jgi:hypothetical protein
MYEVFESFIKVDTWHTGHPCDEGRFYTALNQVVWSEEFDPQKMATFLRSILGHSAEDETSYFAVVIDELRARADVVSAFVRCNGLFEPRLEPAADEASAKDLEVTLSIYTEVDKHLYALEKLTQAVDELATGAGPLRKRLFEAETYLSRISPEQVPEGDLRRTLIGINDDLSFDEPTGNEGRINATLRGTDDEDATAIARRILELYCELRRLLLGGPQGPQG